jgi:hypothetical protein
MRRRRRPGHVGRSLVVRLRGISNVRLLVDRLRRSAIRALYRTRRIGAPHVRAIGIHPLPSRGRGTTQKRARSRCGASGCGQCLRANVDSADRRNRASIQVQRLLMIWPGSKPVLEGPWALGNRPSINGHQLLTPH